jgi:hypothetical protein
VALSSYLCAARVLARGVRATLHADPPVRIPAVTAAFSALCAFAEARPPRVRTRSRGRARASGACACDAPGFAAAVDVRVALRHVRAQWRMAARR